MDWITAHWKDIAAGIGALYALALVIVKLTPTPNDDAALAKVGIVLKVLAKAFGLDLKQGINKKTPIVFMLVGTSLLSGCAAFHGIKDDPAKQYQLSAAVFTESVNVLTALRKAGKIEAKDVESISRVVHLGEGVLKTWSASLKEGRDYPGVEHMAPILLQLRNFANLEGDS
jgi:hypothetical protein